MAVELPQNLEELAELINQASALYNQLQQQAQNEKVESQAAVQAAEANLTALLGPVGAAPGTDSIRAVLAYGQATIESNPGAAVFLVLVGLEQLVANQITVIKALK